MKQTKITRSAIGQTCTLRLGNCSGDDTVVLCHFGIKRGMGKKCHEIHSGYGCFNCHQIEENKSDPRCTWADRFRSMEESQLIMIDLGLIKIEGSKKGWMCAND